MHALLWRQSHDTWISSIRLIECSADGGPRRGAQFLAWPFIFSSSALPRALRMVRHSSWTPKLSTSASVCLCNQNRRAYSLCPWCDFLCQRHFFCCFLSFFYESPFPVVGYTGGRSWCEIRPRLRLFLPSDFAIRILYDEAVVSSNFLGHFSWSVRAWIHTSGIFIGLVSCSLPLLLASSLSSCLFFFIGWTGVSGGAHFSPICRVCGGHG